MTRVFPAGVRLSGPAGPRVSNQDFLPDITLRSGNRGITLFSDPATKFPRRLRLRSPRATRAHFRSHPLSPPIRPSFFSDPTGFHRNPSRTWGFTGALTDSPRRHGGHGGLFIFRFDHLRDLRASVVKTIGGFVPRSFPRRSSRGLPRNCKARLPTPNARRTGR